MASETKNKLELLVDREKLREVITNLGSQRAESDWCVACGAGAASAKLDFPEEVVGNFSKQISDLESLQNFIGNIQDRVGSQADWCVACGAGAQASPTDRLTFPANIPDGAIDEIATKLITAVKLG